MTVEDQPEDKQPLLNEGEVRSFLPSQQQQPAAATLSREEATAQLQTEQLESTINRLELVIIDSINQSFTYSREYI